MKKALVFLVLLSALFLSGCHTSGLSPEEKADTLKTLYADCESFSFTAEITADFQQYVSQFTLKYTGSDTLGTAQVLSPDSIAGISVTFSDGGTTANYDGAELYMGSLDPSGLSPIDALPAILSAWKNGYISQAVYETLDNCDTIAISTPLAESSTLTTWFSLETSLPLNAEVTSDGRTVIFCRFSETEIQ